MSRGQIDFQNVLELVELIQSSSRFSELRLRSGELEIELRRKGAGGEAAAAVAPVAAPVALAATPAPAASAPPAPAAASAAPDRAGLVAVRSPMVGTVYHAPEPGAAPFVRPGQTVAPGDPICIVEVMKLMNSLRSECHGVVREVLVADGQAVEQGQDLFLIAAL
ncbi:MAG: acetyl-CoA carboxylase biotin carboxyl carrier protein [Burkholderiales bacterium]|nr:acetyl-CoA carboxylase biotin carboxyl carrier protein [Burkholderiales bacterium]